MTSWRLNRERLSAGETVGCINLVSITFLQVAKLITDASDETIRLVTREEYRLVFKMVKAKERSLAQSTWEPVATRLQNKIQNDILRCVLLL
jgi:hypothetical protein